jgi:flagellar hook-basal body complex protein FliE
MDNLTIESHLRSLSGAGQLGQAPEIPIPQPPGLDETREVSEKSFKDMLAESIGKVNDLMNESDQAMQDLSAGRSADIHHTLIALQKADISFRMVLEVRNKVMNAYQEVMRMQA